MLARLRAKQRRVDSARARYRRTLRREHGRPIFRLLILPPLIVDGDLEQRFELAELLGELMRTRDRLDRTIDDAKGILRHLMSAKRTYSVITSSCEIRLVPETELRCIDHRCPGSYCAHLHPNGEVVVSAQETGYRYFSVSRHTRRSTKTIAQRLTKPERGSS